MKENQRVLCIGNRGKIKELRAKNSFMLTLKSMEAKKREARPIVCKTYKKLIKRERNIKTNINIT